MCRDCAGYVLCVGGGEHVRAMGHLWLASAAGRHNSGNRQQEELAAAAGTSAAPSTAASTAWLAAVTVRLAAQVRGSVVGRVGGGWVLV